MSIDATTIPAPGALRRGRRGRGVLARRLALSERQLAGGALLLIVALSALIVLAAAGEPTFLSAPARSNYFPSWMSGPLGGIWTGIASEATLKWLFSGAILLSYGAYVLLIRHAGALRMRTLLVAVVALQLIYLLAPPLALTDVFNYLNYARMEIVHHLNPYVTMPVLEPHGDPAYALSNWHGLLSPYGPLFTIFTFVFAHLSPGAYLWIYKGALLIADAGLIALVVAGAQLLGRDRRQALALVALNPIVLVWGLGADHNDFFTIVLVALALYCLLRSGKERQARALRRLAVGGWALGSADLLDGGAGFALAIATGMKASAVVLIPIALAALARERPRVLALLSGVAVGGAIALTASFAAFGAHFPDLAIQSALVTALSMPNLLGLALAQGGETATLHSLITLALVLATAACCLHAYRSSDLLAAGGFSTIAVIATLSWVLPWYIVWVLPFTALAGSERLRRATLWLGLYLILTWVPVASQVMSSVGFHPQQTAVGREHGRAVEELLTP
ncbi:MAG TPA: hypothetical protein VKU89_06110 [Solirubrobacteraceae bacterium]|nr:hypothetical protein [Solirubrobacteraceae bacterium]